LPPIPAAARSSRGSRVLARYSHIRMAAKRKALEGIVSKPAPAAQAAQPTKEQKTAKTQPVQ